VIVDRFSPYHSFPERYGVRDLEPIAGYTDVLPHHADVGAVTYHFTATFESGGLAHPDVIEQMSRGIDAWRTAYYGPVRPQLRVVADGAGFALIDTRGVPDTVPRRAITRDQAITALTQRRVSPAAQREVAWGLEAAVIVVRDGRYVPLAIAEPELMAELSSAAPTAELLQAV
jgi:hypothetical protein